MYKLDTGFFDNKQIIVFPTKELFEQYKEEEVSYCFTELKTLYKAIGTSEREKAKERLVVKRGRFMTLYSEKHK